MLDLLLVPGGGLYVNIFCSLAMRALKADDLLIKSLVPIQLFLIFDCSFHAPNRKPLCSSCEMDCGNASFS